MWLRIAMILVALQGVGLAEKTFKTGTGETWDCAKDSVVTIRTSKGTYGFLGECKRITVAGGKNAVSVATVGKLSVSGSENMVDVEQVDNIVVTGTKNQIKWK